MEKYLVTTVVDRPGLLGRLVKVTERSNGDLLISIFAGRCRGESDDEFVKDLHISVHRSLQSKERINVIKSTLNYSHNGEKQEPDDWRAHTTAIKHNEGIWYIGAYLFTGMFPVLYAADEGIDKTVLPFTFNPLQQSLIVGFMISDASSDFSANSPEFYINSITTSNFKLTMVVSLAAIMSTGFGRIEVTTTLKPDDPPEGVDVKTARNLMKGVSAEECLNRFRCSVYRILIDSTKRHVWLLEKAGGIFEEDAPIVAFMKMMEDHIKEKLTALTVEGRDGYSVFDPLGQRAE